MNDEDAPNGLRDSMADVVDQYDSADDLGRRYVFTEVLRRFSKELFLTYCENAQLQADAFQSKITYLSVGIVIGLGIAYALTWILQ